MLARLKQLRTEFKSDEHGSVMMIFSLVFLVIMLATGAAIDTSRLYHVRASLSSAVDAAALVAGRGLLDGRLSEDEIRQRAKDYFNSNLALEGQATSLSEIADPVITIDRQTGSVSVNAQATVKTTIMRLAGVSQVVVPVRSETKFEQKDIELSLALDLTGSMNSNNRISALKDATTDLVNILLPEDGTPNEVRIAFAPYSSGVNAGEFAGQVTDNTRSGPCTFEREGTQLVSDLVPTDGSFLLEPTDTQIGRQDACPTNTPVVPLTDSRGQLFDAIGTFTGRGYTAGHLGIQWAWFMVSEAWSGVFPSESTPGAYDQDDLVKSVVVMTDGEFNTVRGSNGNVTLSNDLALQMCADMRSRNILVFTVGFELRNTSATNMLRDCAGDKDRFFLAEDGEALRSAFANIADQLNTLRLSK